MTKWEYVKISELIPGQGNDSMTIVTEIRAVFSDPKKEDIVFWKTKNSKWGGGLDEWEQNSMISDISNKIMHEFGQLGWEIITEEKKSMDDENIKEITFKRVYVDEIIDKQHMIDLVVKKPE